MKKILVLFSAVLFSTSMFAQDLAHNAKAIDENNPSGTSVQWNETVYDFGEIEQKKAVTAVFEFTNSGNKPLIISKVQASCGCTATNYSKEPLMPGEKSKITASYNAKRIGAFTKSVTVYSNDKEGEKRLKLKGVVVNK